MSLTAYVAELSPKVAASFSTSFKTTSIIGLKQQNVAVSGYNLGAPLHAVQVLTIDLQLTQVPIKSLMAAAGMYAERTRQYV